MMEYDIEKMLNSILELIEKIDNKDLDEGLKNFLFDYAKLSHEYQIEILNELIRHFAIYNRIRINMENERKCAQEGHIYGDWYKGVSNRTLMWGKVIKMDIWCKKCTRCGNVYHTKSEPPELIKLREEKKIENEIEVLQKKLIKLRSKK